MNWFLLLLAMRPVPAWGLSNTEERLAHMEAEIRALQKTNEDIEQEISMLKRRLETKDGIVSKCPAAIESEQKGNFQESGEYHGEFETGYEDGFYIGSRNEDYKLSIGGCFRTRFRAVDLDGEFNDEFSIKKARLDFNTTILDNYFSRIEIEFADSVKLKDGYLELRHIPEARLRIGQFIVPFTLEAHLLTCYLDFAEGSLAGTNMLFGARDIGVMLNGLLYEGALKYRIALINGSGENKGDNNDAKDVAARLAFQPFRRSENELLSRLYAAVSGTFGDQNTGFSSVSFKTSGGSEFVRFAEGTIHKGNRTRLGTELLYPIGPALIKAECMQMWLDNFQDSSSNVDLHFQGAYVSTAYLLTGERRNAFVVVPNRPFDPTKGSWGAWEIAARYSFFAGDDDLFKHGMAIGTDRAETVTIGVNWYLNEFVRALFDYEHTTFGDAITVDERTFDDEDTFIVQWQVDF